MRYQALRAMFATTSCRYLYGLEISLAYMRMGHPRFAGSIFHLYPTISKITTNKIRDRDPARAHFWRRCMRVSRSSLSGPLGRSTPLFEESNGQ